MSAAGLLVALLAAPLLYLGYRWALLQWRRAATDAPGPAPSLITGTVGQLLAARGPLGRFLTYHEWFGDANDTLTVWGLSLSKDWVSRDPDLAKIAFTQKDLVDKDTVLATRAPEFFGNDLLVAMGDSWKRMRSLLNPAFNHAYLKQSAPVLNKIAGEMEEELLARGPGEVDMAPIFNQLTMRVIGVVGFDYDFKATADPAAYTAAVRAVLKQVLRQAFSKWWWEDLLFESAATKKYRRNLALLDSAVDSAFERRRRLVEEGGEPGTDLLSFMLRDGLLDKKAIRDEVLLFFFAGADTTANLLTAALYLLTTHPEAMAEARREVEAVVGATGDVSGEHLAQLGYVACVLNESLRLFPSAPLVARKVQRTFEFKGHVLSKGDRITLNLYSTLRNPRHWRDPERFDPSRFAAGAEKRHPFAFIPFSAGPRQCIGNRFAFIEATIVLARLVRRFDFAVRPGFEPKPQAAITLFFSGGLPLVVTPRR